MPWSGSAPSQSATRTDGTRTGSDTWQQASAASVKILSTAHDTHDQDLSDMIDDCLKKDGGNTASADIPMGGFSLTGLGSASARTESTNFSDIQDNKGEYVATVGGTADVITLTPSIAITSYAAGQRFTFIAGGTNTTNVTVNVSGVGAKALVLNDGSSTALSAGAITSGQIVDIEYDGTRFHFVNSLTVANDTITFAKMQNIATDTLIGRDTAGTGDPESITLTSADLVMSGSQALGLATTAVTPASYTYASLTVDSKGRLTAASSGTTPASAATQAEQETGSSTTAFTTPGRQQFHASACKVWTRFNNSGTVAASYNTTSVTDNGSGAWTVVIATDFSGTSYCAVGMCGQSGTTPQAMCMKSDSAAGTFALGAGDTSGSGGFVDTLGTDPNHFAAFGDQP